MTRKDETPSPIQKKVQAAKENSGLKTALVLGGGGSRGAYEIGVWQALREMGQPIHMVTGTSVGSLNAAVIVQEAALKTEDPSIDLHRKAVELWEQMDTQTAFSMEKPEIGEFLENGGGSFDELKKLLQQFLDESAIRRSPLDMGLVTVELPSMTPNYLWIPQIPRGRLIDYILASCACFPAVERYEIDGKKYVDGGYADNLPVGMALKQGAEQVIAVDLNAVGIVHKNTMERIGQNASLTLIHSHWDLGNFMEFSLQNTRRIMRLGYLDTLKTFGAYDGHAYCFFKKQMYLPSLRSAEAAAKIFELSPTRLYSRDRFRSDLSQAISQYGTAQQEETRSAIDHLTDSFLESMVSLLRQLNSRTLTLVAASQIKKEGRQKELFLSRPMRSLFEDEIRAASWLVREHLV